IALTLAANGFAVIRNAQDRHIDAQPGELVAVIRARLEAMVDGFEMHDDDASLRRGSMDLRDIAGVHDDRVAFEEAGAAGVEHNDVRAVGIDGLLHSLAPDSVAGDIHIQLSRWAEKEGGHLRHRQTAYLRSLPTPGPSHQDFASA